MPLLGEFALTAAKKSRDATRTRPAARNNYAYVAATLFRYERRFVAVASEGVTVRQRRAASGSSWRFWGEKAAREMWVIDYGRRKVATHR